MLPSLSYLLSKFVSQSMLDSSAVYVSVFIDSLNDLYLSFAPVSSVQLDVIINNEDERRWPDIRQVHKLHFLNLAFGIDVFCTQHMHIFSN